MFSILLGILVCLAGISAVASLQGGSTVAGSDATRQPDAPLRARMFVGIGPGRRMGTDLAAGPAD
jgi:hypothetical protein